MTKERVVLLRILLQPWQQNKDDSGKLLNYILTNIYQQNCMTSNFFGSPSREETILKLTTPHTSETSPEKDQPSWKTSSTKHLENEDPVEHYRTFKHKLLTAMKELDPLAILQSGIFEEYQSTLSPSLIHKSQKNPKRRSISPFELQETCHQSKFNKYQISKGLSIIQLERRSRSCQRISRQARAICRLQEERNIEFVIFASALRSVRQQSPDFKQVSECQAQSNECQNVDLALNKSKISEIPLLLEELTALRNQNQQLSSELSENKSMLEHLRTTSATVNQNHNDRELEYLLKEKQLTRKLREAKQEIDALRNIIDQQHQVRLASGKNVAEEPGEKEVKKEGLMMIRDKVVAQGKLRKALGRAWGAQLWIQE